MKIYFLIFILFVSLIGMIVLCLFKNDQISNNGRDYIEKARLIYGQSCVMCHGEHGEGNGTTARALQVKPPNWTNPMWQSSVTNQGIKDAITGGGISIGRSDFMPSHPEFVDKLVLEGFVELVREFGRR